MYTETEYPPGFLDEAIDQAETARVTGTPERTLEAYRCRGGGPRYIKIGRRVRYIRRDVFAWLKRHRVEASDAA